jgi:peptidoglycan hydrolase CwlO-like protein
MKNKLKIKMIILTLLMGVLAFYNGKVIFAVSTDCSNLDGDEKTKCEELEKKAKVYEDLIKLKDKQQDTLAAQVDMINAEQMTNQEQVKRFQMEVQSLTDQISLLEDDIGEKEEILFSERQILSGMIQSYYEYDQQGVLKVMMLDDGISEVARQSDYMEQSGMKLTDMLSEIKKVRDDLFSKQNELKSKKEKSETLRENLLDRNFDLQVTESKKQSLLIETQGEEEKYRDLLARVEEQKKELFDFNSASNAGEISASVKNYAKPTSSLASTSWYYSQRDSRWGDVKIGNSSSLMKDYGCAITCVSMVFTKKGSSINPGSMAKQKIFYYDLIKWPGTWNNDKIKLASSIGHGNISWSTINAQITKGNPVIVYIKKTNGGGGHYVVVTGKDKKDYIVHDPYFGSNLYLETSKALVGKIGTDSKVIVDQMIIYN